MLLTFFVSGVIGGIMGVLSHLFQNKGILKLPKKTSRGFNTGFLFNLCMGSTAAVTAVLMLTGEQSIRNIIVVSITAGLGGERFLISQGAKLQEKKSVSQKNIDGRLQRLEKFAERTDKNTEENQVKESQAN
ncbi:DUF4257 domain-containing protein [Bacillus cereus]|uniref:DUF4257 domain-containing protein n=1 Tax=Bacillus cereus group TaxID=86661 RepID=UPI0011C7BCF2|nr:DUF4257 domain-containing protein [Bacillus sp. AR18-7]TXR64543.1 DUF4257 domain-containing protein [Bacillus sp. AR18-7]